MADYGYLVEVLTQPRTAVLVADASVSDTQLEVDDAGDFNSSSAEDPDGGGGTLRLGGVELEYTDITWGVTEDDSDFILLADPLAVGADEGDAVDLVLGGLVAEDWYAVVNMGAGDSVYVPLTYAQRAQWAIGIYDPSVPVVVADDLSGIEDAPGRPPAGPGGRVNAWDQDMLTLEGPGEAVLTLTHTPLPMSLLAFWGTQFIPPSERSLSGNVLTIEDSDGVFDVGEVISTWYLYDGAAPATPELPPPGALLSFESSGWSWLQVAISDATDYSAAAFDDSGWDVAPGAFADPLVSAGWASRGWPNGTTQWDVETRMWARRSITATGGVDINVTLRADRAVTMWLDGVQVYTGTPNGVEQTFTIDGADVPSGTSVLAVRITDESSSIGCYFDMEMTQ